MGLAAFLGGYVAAEALFGVLHQTTSHQAIARVLVSIAVGHQDERMDHQFAQHAAFLEAQLVWPGLAAADAATGLGVAVTQRGCPHHGGLAAHALAKQVAVRAIDVGSANDGQSLEDSSSRDGDGFHRGIITRRYGLREEKAVDKAN